MKSVAIIGVLSAVMVLGARTGASGLDEKPRYDRQTARFCSAGVILEFGGPGETWMFTGDERGIKIEKQGRATHETVRPKELEALRRVKRIVAANSEVREGVTPTHHFIGIAVECVSNDGSELEYHMGLCRLDSSKNTDPPQWSSTWYVSNPMATRSVDQPAHAISVGLCGGDSMFMTLQDLARVGANGPDTISTHTYVNHCPGPEPMFSAITGHYFSNKPERVEESVGRAREKSKK